MEFVLQALIGLLSKRVSYLVTFGTRISTKARESRRSNLSLHVMEKEQNKVQIHSCWFRSKEKPGEQHQPLAQI